MAVVLIDVYLATMAMTVGLHVAVLVNIVAEVVALEDDLVLMPTSMSLHVTMRN